MDDQCGIFADEAEIPLFCIENAEQVDAMSLHCIGTIPELFDGNPPFTGRGAVSFAMNVAAILRVVDLLKKYNAE